MLIQLFVQVETNKSESMSYARNTSCTENRPQSQRGPVSILRKRHLQNTLQGIALLNGMADCIDRSWLSGENRSSCGMLQPLALGRCHVLKVTRIHADTWAHCHLGDVTYRYGFAYRPYRVQNLNVHREHTEHSTHSHKIRPQ